MNEPNLDDVQMYVAHFNFKPRMEGETPAQFRGRIAGELRDAGRIIEAHEVQQGCRWDDEQNGANVTDGIVGAMAQAFQGRDYHVSGEAQVGADIAAGAYHRLQKPDMTPDEALLMKTLFGRL